MVSTRSSTRKPPNPSRPSSATSIATQVFDDPPPPSPYPRRSPRIRIKNGENLPPRFITLTPSTIPPSTPTRQPRSHKNLTASSHHTSLNLHTSHHDSPSPTHHQAPADSNDDLPDELTTEDAKHHVDQHVTHVAKLTVRKTSKRRRRRCRGKKTAMDPKQSTLQHTISQLDNLQSDVLVPERLSTDTILAAQSAVQDVRSRKLAAKEAARLKKQVKHLGNLKRPQRVGNVEVALTASFLPIHSASARGRKSAPAFLASCFRKGPKRVPASKIALVSASAKSLRT